MSDTERADAVAAIAARLIDDPDLDAAGWGVHDPQFALRLGEMAVEALRGRAEQTTYRRADGEPVAGEYSFVTDCEWFEDADEFGGEYGEAVEEEWVLVGRRTVKFGPTDVWCVVCDADVVLAEPAPGPHYCDEHEEGR